MLQPRPAARQVDPGTSFDSRVRSQLARILANDLFVRSDRLRAFLRFVVERTLDGKGAGLKEQVLGSELYGRGPEFNGAADPIVRVDARRLRDKLREYYAEFPQDPILVSMPKGSYVPVFEENGDNLPSVASQELPQEGPKAHRLRWPWLVAGALVASTAGVLFFLGSRKNSSLTAGALRITSFPGEKGPPAISPDGNLVAFSSSGPEGAGEADIWVKEVKGNALRRLTETPQFGERSPAWSPNGKEIAFVRDGQGVFIVSQAGGLERRVSTWGSLVGWAPDGESVVIRDNEGDGPYGLFQVLLHNLERRRLTKPDVGVGDWMFSVSPNGSDLAFIRYEHPGVADLFVVSMQGGAPRRLTNWSLGQLQGVAWTPDGKELVYSIGQLWRISAGAAQPGRGVLVAGVSGAANNPSISRPRLGEPARLAYNVATVVHSFRRVDLTAPSYNGILQGETPFAAPADFAFSGPFSPDGTKFMFILGPPPLRLSVSNTDGSQRREIISIQASGLSPGSWSPDGQRLAYDAAIDGNNDIFAVDIDGGRPKRLTQEASLDGIAAWSRDGRWIYFTSTRAGAVPDIWRIPAEGGEAFRVTYHGGIYPQESPDGKYLYYADRPRDGEVGAAKLMRVSVGRGSEIELLSGLTTFWWKVARSGVYFIVRESDFDAIDRYSFSDHRVVRVGRLAGRVGPIGSRLNISPDEHWALVPQESRRSELMLLENFK